MTVTKLSPDYLTKAHNHLWQACDGNPREVLRLTYAEWGALIDAVGWAWYAGYVEGQEVAAETQYDDPFSRLWTMRYPPSDERE